nr:RNA methyltransferase [Croceivirga thetidis]
MVKKLLSLKEKSRERKKTGLFVIEGKRELELAISGGYQIESIFICKDINTELDVHSNFPVIEISRKVYEKLAHRSTTEGVLAIAHAKSHTLNAIALSKRPLILVAEAPEKPGNIGALLRTADAANLDAVLIANPKTDLYNPNIIRSSVGCLFTNKIAVGSSDEIIAYLKENNISIYCAALTASKNYDELDYRNPSSIVVGTESSGLTSEWLENSDQNIIIPMQGQIDSMNVSVSAAILIFEAKRQRGF